MKVNSLLIIGIILFLLACGEDKMKVLNEKFEDLRKNNNIPGMSIAIVKNSKLAYMNGFGFKDLERKLNSDSKTKYRIASVSKLITSIAVMRLYEEGKLKLDEDVSKYLGFELRNPFFPNQVITMRKLLSHTSSLRDGDAYGEFLMTSYSAEKPPDIKDFLTKGEFYQDNIWSKNNGPDENYFEYGNVNFGIIGTVIEIVTGQRFDNFLQKALFDPMELECSFNTAKLKNINDLSVIYRKKDNKWIPQVDNYKGEQPKERLAYEIGKNGLPFGPQGSLRASAEDLAKISVMLINEGKFNNEQILLKSSVNEMIKSVWIENGKNGNGYGGMYQEYALANSTTSLLIPGEKLIGHSGDAYGLLSGMYFSQNKKFAIIFILNGGIWKKGKYSSWQSAEEEIVNLAYDYLKYID